MEINSFQFSRTPDVCFGQGSFVKLPALIKKYGSNVLLVTGGESFKSSQHYSWLTEEMDKLGIGLKCVSVSGEPSPKLIDAVTAQYWDKGIDVVAAVGGGSAIDAGKAISAMLPQAHGDSVVRYLEAKGNEPHNGVKVPFIAVPTTAGTGAEATKNAVLSDVGESGYKSSLRHDNFVPDVALLDPELALTCPRAVTAACGLDAFSQLLEAYVSTTASPMTDALALSGIQHFKAGYERVLEVGDTDAEARGHMAYASLLSGMVLANAGLGLVHGCAGVIGGYFNIPHGVACGTLLAEANRLTIGMLLEDQEKYCIALKKYAKVSSILSGKYPTTVEQDCMALTKSLEDIVNLSGVQRLGTYGMKPSDISMVAAKASNKNNPVKLNGEQIAGLLCSRL